MSHNGVFINIDPNLTTFFMDELDLADSTVDFNKKAEDYIGIYFNKGISDISLCVFEQSSITDSAVFSSRADKYDVTVENEINVDYKKDKRISYHKWLKDNNIDIFKIWFEHLKSGGINPWISFRMNDSHYHGEKTSFLRSDFFYTAKKKGWLLGDKVCRDPYFGECFDYSVPEIQTKMLSYISEQILRYDVYGIELDFVREIACFDYVSNPDCCTIMNDFMRKLRKITKEAEEKFNHPIKIMVRLTRDINESKLYGFDAVYWAENNLVDVIVPSSRWVATDSNMPIDKWVKALDDVEMLERKKIRYALISVNHYENSVKSNFLEDIGVRKVIDRLMFKEKVLIGYDTCEECSVVELDDGTNALFYPKRNVSEEVDNDWILLCKDNYEKYFSELKAFITKRINEGWN